MRRVAANPPRTASRLDNAPRSRFCLVGHASGRRPLTSIVATPSKAMSPSGDEVSTPDE